MREISLYRHFDASGQLLYVGISKNALCRLGGHKNATWYRDLARISVEHHKSRAHALYAEAIAIRDEKPLYNKNQPTPIDPDLPIEPAAAPNRKPIVRQSLFSRLPGLGNSARTILYTVLPAKRGAQAVLDKVARTIDAPGFAIADLGEVADGFDRVMRSAQHAGTRIITVRPDAFAGVGDLLREKGASLVVSNDAWEIQPGGNVERLLDEIARAQNTANVAAYRQRKS